MPSTARGTTMVAATMALTTTFTLGLAGAAFGHGQKPFPTKTQVTQAHQRVVQKTQDVAMIRAELVVATTNLSAAQQQAEIAAEKYNGALWHLAEAKQTAAKAQAAASAAAVRVAAQRKLIALLVAESYQQGTQINTLNALFSNAGPKGLIDEVGAVQSAGSSMQARYEQFNALSAIAKMSQARADEARNRMAGLARQAKSDRAMAGQAASDAQAAASSISVQKQQLVSDLAQAQHISVSLATKRQNALQAIAKAKAEAAARAKAKAEARAAKARAEAQARAAERARRRAAHGGSTSAPPPYVPPPTDPNPPAPNRRAAKAIAFAEAQLGKPYLWGGAGPAAYDCSGLTMMAWRAGGVSLVHYAAAQYEESTPITINQIKPGDLLFWGTSNNPASIHHVAIYLGNGMMIQAPHTGAYVDEVSVYSWLPPNFFGRV